ncbi:uncharacterized protein CMU_043320 [Cryptosporidium muris RN66]|uniref:Uncharacterized protein n=1 Tax=Cryptosporidium muris (strain RN66) TaxID=441375 RepID=B6AAL7_CRYMR|nr:uncharacterized protein CMU_043320 [Cryptosporidium muris RN66]EEA05258.1 hypothetical protein CMU_043320 [Cryptosporidium muris RN66]|eukprot:XP_002139607.1 hypothetical protein [Cryptosporidium muris RN66]
MKLGELSEGNMTMTMHPTSVLQLPDGRNVMICPDGSGKYLIKEVAVDEPSTRKEEQEVTTIDAIPQQNIPQQYRPQYQPQQYQPQQYQPQQYQPQQYQPQQYQPQQYQPQQYQQQHQPQQNSIPKDYLQRIPPFSPYPQVSDLYDAQCLYNRANKDLYDLNFQLEQLGSFGITSGSFNEFQYRTFKQRIQYIKSVINYLEDTFGYQVRTMPRIRRNGPIGTTTIVINNVEVPFFRPIPVPIPIGSFIPYTPLFPYFGPDFYDVNLYFGNSYFQPFLFNPGSAFYLFGSNYFNIDISLFSSPLSFSYDPFFTSTFFDVGFQYPIQGFYSPYIGIGDFSGPFSNIVSVDTPFMDYNSIQTPLGGVTSIDTPLADITSMDTPFADITSIDTPFADITSIDTPFADITSIDTPFADITSIDTTL